MSSRYAKLLVAIAAFALAAFTMLGLQQTFAADEKETAQQMLIAHPVTPGTPTPTPPRQYSLPFNRNENAVITLGPGEPDHTGKSNEAIDFSPKTYGWTQILAVKPGHVYINSSFANWGNLVVVQSDVAPYADAFYAYYAHLANPPPTFGIGDQVADRQSIGTVGCTGNTCTGTHIHTELRDLMSNNANNTGNSTNHPIRRLRGIGWFPWYPNANMNSGFVPRSTSHPIGGCCSNPILIMRWPAPSEFYHVDGNGVDQLAGYSWTLSTNPSDVPDTIQDGTAGTYGAQFTVPVASTKTKWFFHLRARGVNSGWAADDQVAHQGPYKIKTGCSSSPLPGDWDDVPGMDE